MDNSSARTGDKWSERSSPLLQSPGQGGADPQQHSGTHLDSDDDITQAQLTPVRGSSDLSLLHTPLTIPPSNVGVFNSFQTGMKRGSEDTTQPSPKKTSTGSSFTASTPTSHVSMRSNNSMEDSFGNEIEIEEDHSDPYAAMNECGVPKGNKPAEVSINTTTNVSFTFPSRKEQIRNRGLSQSNIMKFFKNDKPLTPTVKTQKGTDSLPHTTDSSVSHTQTRQNTDRKRCKPKKGYNHKNKNRKRGLSPTKTVNTPDTSRENRARIPFSCSTATLGSTSDTRGDSGTSEKGQNQGLPHTTHCGRSGRHSLVPPSTPTHCGRGGRHSLVPPSTSTPTPTQSRKRKLSEKDQGNLSDLLSLIEETPSKKCKTTGSDADFLSESLSFGTVREHLNFSQDPYWVHSYQTIDTTDRSPHSQPRPLFSFDNDLNWLESDPFKLSEHFAKTDLVPSQSLEKLLPKPAHKLWKTAKSDGNMAAKLSVRKWYFNNNKTHNLLEGWCLGIAEHPQWFKDAEDLKESIELKRREAAWAIHDLTAEHIQRSYDNCKESRTGALHGVSKVLNNHVSAQDKVRLVALLKADLEESAKRIGESESLIYKDKSESLQERLPEEGDFINPFGGARRILKAEMATKTAAEKAKKDKEVAEKALKASLASIEKEKNRAAKATQSAQAAQSTSHDETQEPYDGLNSHPPPQGGQGRGQRPDNRGYWPRSRGRGRGRNRGYYRGGY